ncbi:hypothetical protein WJH60_21960 [Burkholderia orbicola]|uniref:hypothetical protein n=1 Tax=Burkholderia orbicola TaxID=2978683 RepID=UPI0035C71EB7
MSTELNLVLLDNARSAILCRFRELETRPNGTVKLSLFLEQMNQYRGGYFWAAMEQLANEQCIEDVIPRLLPPDAARLRSGARIKM